jgi:hypothetical protein
VGGGGGQGREGRIRRESYVFRYPLESKSELDEKPTLKRQGRQGGRFMNNLEVLEDT